MAALRAVDGAYAPGPAWGCNKGTACLCAPQGMMFMVCDGHAGVEAAKFVTETFHSLLCERLLLLPPDLPHPSDKAGEAKVPQRSQRPEQPLRMSLHRRCAGMTVNSAAPCLRATRLVSLAAVEAFAERLRRHISDTFIAVDNAWTELGHLAGLCDRRQLLPKGLRHRRCNRLLVEQTHHTTFTCTPLPAHPDAARPDNVSRGSSTAGTTVSMVLITDYLMTVANTGDSEGVLDTGVSMLELTESHRIQTHDAERQRLRSAGCQVAQLGFHLEGPARPGEPGVGPLRIWPGGLCVSRSVGDVDAGPEIVPIPHIKQVCRHRARIRGKQGGGAAAHLAGGPVRVEERGGCECRARDHANPTHQAGV